MKLWNNLLMILLIITGCSWNEGGSEEQIYIEALNEILNRENKLEDGVYIIIPNVGCESCISFAEEFLLANLNHDNLSFIITKFSSTKKVKIQLGARVIESSNVILDINDTIYKKGLDSIYPTIIYLNKTKIKKIEYLNPENDSALYNVNTYLLAL